MLAGPGARYDTSRRRACGVQQAQGNRAAGLACCEHASLSLLVRLLHALVDGVLHLPRDRGWCVRCCMAPRCPGAAPAPVQALLQALEPPGF